MDLTKFDETIFFSHLTLFFKPIIMMIIFFISGAITFRDFTENISDMFQKEMF